MKAFHRLGLCLVASTGAIAAAAPDARTPDEVRAIVAEMLADAGTRTSLLDSASPAGHDGRHFFLASDDGAFRLNVSGQIQFRYTLNLRDADDEPDDEIDDDDTTPGFSTVRTKIAFSGHLFEPALFYRVQGAFDRDGGVSGRYSLASEDAVELLTQAAAAANAVGMGWNEEPIDLHPAPKLVDLIRKSRAVAAVAGDALEEE